MNTNTKRRLEKRLEQMESDSPAVMLTREEMTVSTDEKDELDEIFSPPTSDAVDAELARINEETNGLSVKEKIDHWRESRG